MAPQSGFTTDEGINTNWKNYAYNNSVPATMANSGQQGSTDIFGNISSFADMFGGMFGGGYTPTYDAAAISGAGSPALALDMQKANQLGKTNFDANSFDFGSAFSTGLSAFDTINKYKMQNEQMDMYKQQVGRANAQQDLVNKRHDSAVSAFA